MGILVKKNRGGVVFTGITKLAITGFIVALASASVDTIWAVYMEGFVKIPALVGFLSALFTVVAFFSYFLFVPLIEKLNKGKLYLFTLVGFAVGYFLFWINRNFYVFVVLEFVLMILVTIKIVSFGIIIKDKSTQRTLPRNEGLVYTFFNIAWVIGPLMAGYISEKFGVNTIFLLSSIFLIIAAGSFTLFHIKDGRVKKNVDKHVIRNFKDFFKDKSRVLAYIVGGGVSMWWVLIYLFMPLYILENGLHTLWIGYFLFAVSVPLILLEFPLSKVTAKVGFRKMFVTGFLGVGVTSFICFFIPNFYIVLGLLAFASVWMAMLEPTAETYFFDVTKGKDEQRFYGPYNTALDINHFIGKILASTILIFLPFKYLFILFAIFMVTLSVVSLRTKNIVGEVKLQDGIEEEARVG